MNQFKARTPNKLWQCKGLDEQAAWCQAKLETGATLSDPGIWIAGADPKKIIRKLRREGLQIETVYIKTVDASGVKHPKTLAWRLKNPR